MTIQRYDLRVMNEVLWEFTHKDGRWCLYEEAERKIAALEALREHYLAAANKLAKEVTNLRRQLAAAEGRIQLLEEGDDPTP